MRNSGAIVLVAGSILSSGCNKPTPATADSATVSSTATTSKTTAAAFDETAARAQILGADSAYQRAMQSKNVDSLMIYYEPSIVSMSEGAKPVKGAADLRTVYTKAVKANLRDLSFQSGGVSFSNDHSMAWDWGTYSGTSDGPNGKPVKGTGSFMNVWKNVGGRWFLVAEISNSSP
jgi:ketosteroid isomerase-like protein